jgi:hypothetical protein
MAKRGVTSVLVTSTAFVGLARMEAEAMGYADLPMLIVPHPFGSRTSQEVEAFARTKADEVEKVLAIRD